MIIYVIEKWDYEHSQVVFADTTIRLSTVLNYAIEYPENGRGSGISIFKDSVLVANYDLCRSKIVALINTQQFINNTDVFIWDNELYSIFSQIITTWNKLAEEFERKSQMDLETDERALLAQLKAKYELEDI